MLLFLDSLGQRGAHVAPYTDESFEARSVSERRRALRSAKACLASQHQAQQSDPGGSGAGEEQECYAC